VTAAPGETAPLRFTAERAEDTRALAARLARVARPGDVVALYGELG
jgi:hypothetical protein